MMRTEKIKLNMNEESLKIVREISDVSRRLYNFCLEKTKEHYKNTGKFLSPYILKKELPKWKKTWKDLNFIHSKTAQETVLRLGQNYYSFFTLRKNGDKSCAR